ncbi:MAG: sugar porter family MFS transporter [Bacteroidota bacterium]
MAISPSFIESKPPLSPPPIQIQTGFILLVSGVAALGGLLFGFDTAIISGTIPYLKTYFSLDEYMLGWAVGCILIGCGVGALLAGKLAEAYGRKYVLIGCAILFALSGLGAGLATSLNVFVAFRLLGGLGVGAAAMVSPMYIAEMAPASWRGRLVSLYQLAIVTGILLAYLSNYALADLGENNWRWMFASQTFPAVLFLLLLFLVPETPRWLVKKGRSEEARLVLQKTGGEAFSRSELTAIVSSFQHEKQSTLSELFSPQHRGIVGIGVLIAVFQQITGINAILYYAPEIFKETGLNTSGSLLQTLSIGVVNVLSTFIAIGLVDRIGRKRLLLIGSLLMGLSLVSVALCFQYKYYENYLVLIATLVYVAAFGCTLGAVTWVYLSEIFPNRIRGLAMSAATLALWLADFVVTYTFPVMTQQLGTSATLFTYALFCAVAFVYIFVKVPETKGKTLEEIEKLVVK